MPTQPDIAKPLSRYAPFRRAGDLVFFAGIVAADPATGKVVTGYADLPPEVRKQAGETGEMSTVMKAGCHQLTASGVAAVREVSAILSLLR